MSDLSFDVAVAPDKVIIYILSKTAISPMDNMCLTQKANHSVQRFSTSILYASSLSRFLYCCFWCYILNFLYYFYLIEIQITVLRTSFYQRKGHVYKNR